MVGLTLCSVLVSYVISFNFKDKKKAFLLLAGILITFILGSRYFINGFTDEITYNYLYEGYANWSFERLRATISDGRDWGFTLFYWCMAKIIPWRQFPIYFITAFFIFSSFRFIYYNSDDPLLSVLLIFAFGIFSFCMAGYRQCFAMCFCLIAFECAKKRKIIPYLIFCFIAISMHLSSVIFIPMYWLLQVDTQKTKVGVWVLILLLMSISSSMLLRLAADMFDKEGYLLENEFSLFGMIIQVVILIVPMIIKISGLCEREKNYNLNTILWLTAIGLIFYLLRATYLSYERLSYYYTFFIVSSMSGVIFSLRKRDRFDKSDKVVRAVVLIILLILVAWRMPTNLTFFWEH